MAKLTIEYDGLRAEYKVNDTILKNVLGAFADSEGLADASDQERLDWLAEIVLPRALNADVSRLAQAKVRNEERVKSRELREERRAQRDSRRNNIPQL